jgi:SAM-dependent methyltransferase
MQSSKYLMENDEEAFRLDLKTDNEVTTKQALWAGIKPGMRVADIGFGSGKTTSRLNELVQPGGSAVGIDISEQRVEFAKEHYDCPEVEFLWRDARKSLDDLGTFDFVWVRFLLEYYLKESFDLVENIAKRVKPGGILCLIDLDYNCLTHYGLPMRLERTLLALGKLNQKVNFDPFVGRKLYSFLYDLGFKEINVDISGHHVIFGELKKTDAFNWVKKAEVIPKKIGFEFDEYPGGYVEFFEEFKKFFAQPRRFTYSPIISCRGRKPKS